MKFTCLLCKVEFRRLYIEAIGILYNTHNLKDVNILFTLLYLPYKHIFSKFYIGIIYNKLSGIRQNRESVFSKNIN